MERFFTIDDGGDAIFNEAVNIRMNAAAPSGGSMGLLFPSLLEASVEHAGLESQPNRHVDVEKISEWFTMNWLDAW